jgi:hypothetical protein
MTERGMSAAVLSAVNWAGKQVNSKCAIRFTVHPIDVHPFSRFAALFALFAVRKAEWLPDAPGALHLREFLPSYKKRS